MAWDPSRPRFEGLGGNLRRKALAWAYASKGISPPSDRSSNQAGTEQPYTGSNRVSDGLICEWWFDEGSGNTVKDLAPLNFASNLTIVSGTSWIQDEDHNNRYALSSSDGHITGPFSEIYDYVAGPNAPTSKGLTLEVWVKPDNVTQDGPARIFGVSDPNSASDTRNFMVGQGAYSTLADDQFRTRVRLDTSEDDGYRFGTGAGTASTDLQHLCVTVSPNDDSSETTMKFYVDADLKATEVVDYWGTTTAASLFDSWDSSYELAFGNESDPNDADRPWYGVFYLAAVYNKALNAGEVYQNFSQGVVTDSVLPAPKVGFASGTSECFADGTRATVDVSVSGKRNSGITLGYHASSTNISFAVTTNYPTTNIGKNSYEKTLRFQVSGPGTNLNDGTIDIVLSSLSPGTISSDASSHTISVSSLVLPLPDLYTPLSSVDFVFTPTTNEIQAALILSRPHAYDVSTTVSAGASDAYAIKDEDGNLSALPAEVTLIIPSGTESSYVTFARSGSDQVWTEDDIITFTLEGASGYDDTPLTIPHVEPGTFSSCEITLKEEEQSPRPTSGNTGPRDSVILEDWTYGNKFVDTTNSYANQDGYFAVPPEGITITGKQFKGTVNLALAAPIRFVDCSFSGGPSLPIDSQAKGAVYQKKVDNVVGAPEAEFEYCSFSDGENVWVGSFKSMYRCSFNRAYRSDLMHINYTYPDNEIKVTECWFGPHLRMSGFYEGSPHSDPLQFIRVYPVGATFTGCSFHGGCQSWYDGTSNPDRDQEYDSLIDKTCQFQDYSDMGPVTFNSCWFTGGNNFMFSNSPPGDNEGVFFNGCSWETQAKSGILNTGVPITADGNNVWTSTGTKKIKGPDSTIYDINDILNRTQTLSLKNLNVNGLVDWTKRSTPCDDDGNCPPA